MTNQEIGDRLHELVAAGEYFTAYDELFSEKAKAIEPQLSAQGLAQVEGLAAIKSKVAMLSEGIQEIISREISDPIVTQTHIAFSNNVNAKLKDNSDFTLSEICLYRIESGKIISEEFIY